MKPEATVSLGLHLRVAGALASFGIAYGGVLLLEGKVHIGQGVAWLAVAAITLVVAGLGFHLAPIADDDIPATAAGRRRRAEDGVWQRARRWVASLGLGWWVLLAVASASGSRSAST
jgi:hypothetical protein